MKKIFCLSLLAMLTFSSKLTAQEVHFSEIKSGNTLTFVLENKKVRQSVVVRNALLFSDTLQTKPSWAASFHRPAAQLVSDANFALNVVWIGLRAPGKNNNAENPERYHPFTIKARLRT